MRMNKFGDFVHLQAIFAFAVNKNGDFVHPPVIYASTRRCQSSMVILNLLSNLISIPLLSSTS